ncbi:MAG TPA: glycosyltransferase family 39 protein [Gaiellaceae bacterium]
MARALRRPALIAALPALVGISTLLHWLAGRRIAGLWIMPDEAIYADRAQSLWRHGSLPVLHGAGAGYSVLYPALAGLPLAVGSLAHGYASLKLLQALVGSLAAVPVFAYGRRLMPNGYALLAAALTVSSPILLYSGFVMTEVLYYPVSAVTTVAIARAVTTGTVRHQLLALAAVAVAVATHVQAVVFVPVFAAAILLDALMARDARRLRAFVPVWVAAAALAVVALVAARVLGAYATAISSGYPLAASVRLAYEHLAYVALMVGVAPVAVAAILAAEAARGREPDPEARALVATTIAVAVLVAAEVGTFAARYAPHLLGRDLAAVPPSLFLVFCLWLARGMPRPRIVASAAVFGVAATVLAAPWNHLIVKTALPDTLGIAPFLEHGGIEPATEIAVPVVVMILLVRYVPRPLWAVLPALVLVVLAASSVSATSLVAGKVRFDQAAMVGTPRDWVERASPEPVAYVFTGDPATVNVVWQQRFWNPRILDVVAVAPAVFEGPVRSRRQVEPAPDGSLPVAERLAVTNADVSLVGSEVARQDRGPDYPPLVLWRLDGRPRLNAVLGGVKPNGDILGSASVTAYGCRGGSLQLTLLPKSTDVVTVSLDGAVVLRRRIANLAYWNGTVPVPPTHHSDVCHFTVAGGLLLGSTRIAFVRD